jgi:peptide/nickel transport system permease protein
VKILGWLDEAPDLFLRRRGGALKTIRILAALILRRLLLGLFTLFVVSVMIFWSVELLPGDLASEVLGQSATPETLAAFRERFGLNDPAPQRYIAWLFGIVQGDFGISMASLRPIADMIGARTFNTFFLAAYAAVIAIPLAITLGLVAALYRGSAVDRCTSIVTLVIISFPEFFVAYILILIFSAHLGWLPSLANVSSGMAFSERLIVTLLPATTMVLIVVAHTMRMTRAAIVNLLSSSYIEMAHLKGLKRARVIVVHALPNAIAPIATVVSLNLAYLIVGVVLVEVVFVYPGLGQLLVDSVSKRDIAVVQAACLIFAATYIVLNMLADIVSIASNPRRLHPR